MWFLVIILIIIVLSITFSPRSKSEEKQLKKAQELDEELEDYDYLDEITGTDDKPWI